jgi:hypothetical protein
MVEKESKRISDFTINNPHTIYGSIYFKTAGSYLTPDDYKILDELVGFCGVLLIYSKVALYFNGMADIRGQETYNKKLSEDRANTVKNYVDSKLSLSKNYISFGTGFGEAKSGMDFDEDRRVDIFITQIIIKERTKKFKIKLSDFPKPYYSPETTYPYQEICDNLNKCKPHVLKYYHPDYDKLWKPLQDLISTIENLYTINREEYIHQFVKDEHINHIITLVDNYYEKYEIENALKDLKYNAPKEVWGQCFRIIYSREYDKALDLADKDWSSSDFKYYCEWWGQKLHLAPPDAPYTRKTSRR